MYSKPGITIHFHKLCLEINRCALPYDDMAMIISLSKQSQIVVFNNHDTTILHCPTDIWCMKQVPLPFYMQQDVVDIARSLLGKILHTALDGHYTAGIIVETEAYNGVIDKASHAYGNRRTKRTEVMYAQGGVAYVYLCYGIHHLFNVVTNVAGVPHAVLIRALEPLHGIDVMMERRHKLKADFSITKGPGSVAQALGLHTRHSGETLLGPAIWITEAKEEMNQKEIIASPRIGVDYAQEDALLPYRFYLENNPYVSGKIRK